MALPPGVRREAPATLLAMSKPLSPVVVATSKSFEAEVLRSDVPVLVDFTATWCGPCKALGKVLEGVARDHAGALRVVSVDIDDAPDIAAQYGVRAVPTVVAFDHGAKVGQRLGLTTRDKLFELLPAREQDARMAPSR